MLKPTSQPLQSIPPKAAVALLQLLAANEYAEETEQSEWEFALEMPQLEVSGVTRSELRLLLHLKFVGHCREITSDDDDHRVFQQAKVRITDQSCFVLTQDGRRAAQWLAEHHLSEGNASATSQASTCEVIPRWDPLRRQLHYSGRLIKAFRFPAENQEAVLGAFEERGWPGRIADPLAPTHMPAQRRLRDAIKGLNRHQSHTDLIRFHGDGTGEGVVWEAISRT